MKLRKLIKRLVGSGILIGIPAKLTYIWWYFNSWIYFTPIGELRAIDTWLPELALTGLVASWVILGTLAIANLLVE